MMARLLVMSPLAFCSGVRRGSAGDVHAPFNDVDGGCRVAACAHGPDHLFQIGHIDILVNDDDKPVGVVRCLALRGDMAGLF